MGHKWLDLDPNCDKIILHFTTVANAVDSRDLNTVLGGG